jgi:hypothetical protein
VFDGVDVGKREVGDAKIRLVESSFPHRATSSRQHNTGAYYVNKTGKIRKVRSK